jgi:large subunit ribosomal protein L18
MAFKLEGRARRRRRIRKKVQGTMERPRLSVFRSHRQIYAQVIDDQAGRTLAAACSIGIEIEKPAAPAAKAAAGGDEIEKPAAPAAKAAAGGDDKEPKKEDTKDKKGKEKKEKAKAEKLSLKLAMARKVGAAIAAECRQKGIQKVVFDRSGYLYHGRVKALAEAARKAGLEF